MLGYLDITGKVDSVILETVMLHGLVPETRLFALGISLLRMEARERI